ncbi:Defensin-like protein [Zostera marina]|uniref:Defensin-like protein n=1 Tax=Zostera marina TaxID=29655 RepID=A0A0K9NTH1_ZOSMR|nr:Defensin-like protein [Zostera marina]
MGVQLSYGRTCTTKSQRFKGHCFRARNCAYICRTEGYHGGKCHGFHKHCLCHKPC